jgi:hypothetical protein
VSLYNRQPLLYIKSGSNQLERNIIPDSIAEAPLVGFAKIGVRSMKWGTSDALASFANDSFITIQPGKDPTLFNLFLILWLVVGESNCSS